MGLGLLITGSAAFNCFQDRFPLTVGCDTHNSGITDITFESANLIFGGWSECTGLLADSASKSGLLGVHSGTAF